MNTSQINVIGFLFLGTAVILLLVTNSPIANYFSGVAGGLFLGNLLRDIL